MAFLVGWVLVLLLLALWSGLVMTIHAFLAGLLAHAGSVGTGGWELPASLRDWLPTALGDWLVSTVACRQAQPCASKSWRPCSALAACRCARRCASSRPSHCCRW